MITIKCAKCKSKLFKYVKVGKGQILHLWPVRIVEDFSVRDGSRVMCRCGNIIGKDEKKWIKMKKNAFTYTGRKSG